MSYSLGPVKPWTKAAAEELGRRFGITTIGGYRAGAIDPNGHPAGRALDFMVSDDRGTALANYAMANSHRLGVEYVIWRQRIWSVARRGEGWRKMSDRGSRTANHFDHVHVNFIATAPPGFSSSSSSKPPAATVIPKSTHKPADGSAGSAWLDSMNPGRRRPTSSSTPEPVEQVGFFDDVAGLGDKIRGLAIVAAFLLGGVALIAVGTAATTAPARKRATDAALDVLSVVPQTAVAANAAKAATSRS